MWFEVSGEKWYPIEEQESSRIEHEHRQRTWRAKVCGGWRGRGREGGRQGGREGGGREGGREGGGRGRQ